MSAPKSCLRYAFHYCGGLWWVRHRSRHGARILMYHRFGSGRDVRVLLEQQCRHLRKCYHIISLTELGERLRSGSDLPPKSLVVTVDDGYRDFFEVAYPVFARYQIPVTVFLVTDFLDGESWLWVDRLQYALAYATVDSFEITADRVARRFLLHTRDQREQAHAYLQQMSKQVPNSERLRILDELPRLLRVTVPTAPPDDFAPLSWQQVRGMAQNGVDFGAHTRSHPIVSRLGDAGQLDYEIRGSKIRIEQELQREVAHFCYPNGQIQDISPEAICAVRSAGFRTAVTAQAGLNYAGQDPFQLKRLGAEPDLPRLYFREQAAAFRRT